MRPSRLLRAACILLTGAIAATLWWGYLFLEHAREDAIRAVDEFNAETERMMTVYDRPIPEGNVMQLWLQDDPQWAHVPYAVGTVGDSGCGLVCAAMALEYMTLQRVTPLQLADYVGDSCLTDGVNDMGKFCRYIEEAYPEYEIESTGQMWRIDDALALVRDGWLVFCGMSGELGDSEYDGHVVMLWMEQDGSYWMRDPDSGGNSQRAWTEDELREVDWLYFYGIRGGYYGAQRN